MKNRLKDLREDHDLTQQMVADQIGITQRKYSYIETGIQQLTAELLVSLALLYNVSIDYLLSRRITPIVIDFQILHAKNGRRPRNEDSGRSHFLKFRFSH